MTETLCVTIRGRVQGVGYRYFVVDRARELELAGWAKNLPDGSVEVEAQGPREDLERLADELGQGPSVAHVTGLDVVFAERPAYHGFEIRW